MFVASSVVVVIGCGGMGLAIARRLGSGSHLVIADFAQVQLDHAVQLLRDEGYTVDAILADVSDMASVQSLAQHAAKLGPIQIIAHTAGVSSIQASADRIYRTNLLGVVHVIDSFLPFALPGSSLIVISSVAGHFTLSVEFERHLATAPIDELLSFNDFESAISDSTKETPGLRAYRISKRANILRVQASAVVWGKKGARINSVSPGIISTPMGREELAGPLGDTLREIIVNNPIAKVGTASDVANAVAFLASRDASFITGTDLLLDGGWHAARLWE